uniref:Uncharacterized protein n=1 Tax=Anguilla anguilla TaxID=7936 RepID=A0A0E9XL74_ANGAN
MFAIMELIRISI